MKMISTLTTSKSFSLALALHALLLLLTQVRLTGAAAAAGVVPRVHHDESSNSGGCVSGRRGLFELEGEYEPDLGCGADVGNLEDEYRYGVGDEDEQAQLRFGVPEGLYDAAGFQSILNMEDLDSVFGVDDAELEEVSKDRDIAIAEADMVKAAQRVGTMKSCRSCQALLFSLKRLASLGDDVFVNTLVRTCKNRKLQDPDICEGDVGAQGPVIAYAVRRMSSNGRTARQFCKAVFGMCDVEPVEPYDFPMPPISSSEARISGSADDGGDVVRREPFKVVHVSDVHIDRYYTVGAEANCTKYICCREFDSSAGEDVSVPAEPFGDRRCDSPIRLANSMLRGIRELVPDALFTISTGDVVDHANWLLTQEIVEDELHGFHEQLFMNLSSSNRFYGSIGNHDGYPTNDFPRTTSEDPSAANWVFDLLSADWQRWIGNDGASSVQHNSGSYAIVHPGTKLKLISLNTQYWYKFNFYLYDSDDFQPDPNGILSFLVTELDAAEKAGQKAWIFGHVPPGNGDAMLDQSNYFNQIVTRYRETIAGQFYGHTHHDEFQIAYTDYSNQTAANAMSFGLVAPSLTPTNGNPAFTVYDVDPDSYDIMDVKVYIANMTRPKYHILPKWELYYSAREAYGPVVASLLANKTTIDRDNTSSTLPQPPHPHPHSPKHQPQPQYPPTSPLDARFWHHLTDVFLLSNHTFAEFVARRRRMPIWLLEGDGNDGKRVLRGCGDKCRNDTVCDLRAMRAEDSCYTHTLKDVVGMPPIPPMFDDNGVDDGEVFRGLYEGEGECEGSAFSSIMRKLAVSGS